MEIVFAILIIAVVGVGAYLADGPHCPKHVFTKLKRGTLTEVNSHLFELGSVSEKQVKVEWVCPKCGQVVVKTEIAERRI